MATRFSLTRMTYAGGIEAILVTRAEAARLLSVSLTQLDEKRRVGRIIAKRLGRRLLFEVDDLRRYAAALPSDELR
jgi:nucleotidyltransferase/DNA polymerase involved in DNA repair